MNRAILVLTLLLSFPALASTADHASLLDAYESIHAELIVEADSDLAGLAGVISTAAQNMAEQAPAEAGLEADADELLSEIATAADQLAAADGLDEQRTAFYELSKPLIRLRAQAQSQRMKVAYCPMVKRSWMQSGDEIENPYDPSMLRCGSFVGQ